MRRDPRHVADTEAEPARSKSEVKRELAALHKLGRELVDLPGKSLDRLPLSAPAREAVVQARQLQRGALQRQLKYIGRLMRDEDAAAVRSALVELKKPGAEAVRRLHEVEALRDALLAGDDKLLEELCTRYPAFDRGHVRQLIRNANKEQVHARPPAAARALFRYLKDTISDD